ncbi:nucleotidyltransferase AbiEii toxin of type IV toxin-antitoxin system [Herbihabitans rhizosphaerae]|uniref:Nucleotidyltransferase AbiEii toxin of type IV toxin-antitoxin system n=1 Tax=Herbihabitans rhizosphaerae TaxID=1872711 RepID=A0A4V2ETH2_9PSEU|nr:nucleotidyl transferase AbiEii/AbiGii toxin family protein [Herbihabitans rhizosphaerae]RZS41063.1 nucleotidyltransferase AbiEii toxin of type IV toxin-antitoxin system [Herbihabitans rhizosphaerae]
MLDPSEEVAVADQFGVARDQVRRDHLISHLLAALSSRAAGDVVFFGGTALSRTFAPDGRLSEDIDLIATRDRRDTAALVQDCSIRETRREFPGLRWDPPLTNVRDTRPAVLTTTEGITVRIQLLRADGYPKWPTAMTSLVQRYSDAAPATLAVPTAAAFAAAKTVAWMDRAASRDLFDLWLLSQAGAINGEAADLFARHGPTAKAPAVSLFNRAPNESTWHRDLSGQTRLSVTPVEALDTVRRAWLAAV